MFDNPKIRINELSVGYDDGTQALSDVCLDIPENAITALFGPAGGGKSTLLRTLNRLNDLLDVSISGEVMLDDTNIFDRNVDVISLRRRVGIVFAQPIPLPFSIRKNITYGLELAGERRRAKLDDAVEGSLRSSALWDEVKDRLNDSAAALSGGQQQRLCIARVLALAPEVLLLDEPTTGLSPLYVDMFFEKITEIHESRGVSIMLAEQNATKALEVADRVMVLSLGEVFLTGDAQELTTEQLKEGYRI